ncbi:hypothetical protein C2G38_721424 [Gigaspora rosea]|uniref:CCHC-type domain-containing protein n=1 Tax=Gigaspora rosea TaxID=44941 RepID=A0A397VQD7_9GLOM|nr:hypothetical protein C2G38_721424 [Gigaspora rosea]
MANRGRGGCYKCGESGHLARDCSLSAVWKEGHISRDCTETPKEKTCYKCGDSGHISRDCYSDSATGNSGSKCFKVHNFIKYYIICFTFYLHNIL